MNSIQISQAQGRVPVTIFHVKDRINMGDVVELEETTQKAYDDGMRNLVIDLGEIVSLSSIGVRAFVIIHKLLSTDGGNHFKLANPVSYIREVLDISGVTQYIEVYNSVEEAVVSF